MQWTDAFKLAEKYYAEHGNLLVPKGYFSDGFNLYSWISKQRHRYSMSHSPNFAEDKGQDEKEQKKRKIRK